jgi:hypothetical protein
LESKTQNGQFCNPPSPTSKTDGQIFTGNKLTEHVIVIQVQDTIQKLEAEVFAVWMQMSGVYKKISWRKEK